MLDIDIAGRIRQKDTVYQYIENICNKLDIYDTDNILEIEIHKDLDGHYGYCGYDGDTIIVQVARNIFGNKIKYGGLLTTLSHELVHCKQFITGELTNAGYCWKGHHTDNWKDTPYKDKPWEIEPMAREYELLHACWPIPINEQDMLRK